MSEPKTAERVRSDFISSVKNAVWYWSTQSEAETKKDLCEGVAFSIMAIIDGVSGDFPCAIDLVCRPHEDDRQYNIDNNDDWIDDGTVINECMLHEMVLKDGQ